jgi:hypothetical protein
MTDAMTEAKTDAKKPHPYDLFVNEKKVPQWIANFDAEERREQYFEDVNEGKLVLKLITGIACIGLVLGIVVLSYMYFVGTP